MTEFSYHLRTATLGDIAALTDLIAGSARDLSAGYSAAQIEAALGSAFGVDVQLISDGTYYVAAIGDRLIACGGWSRRARLFGAGGNAAAENTETMLDPSCDAARVRAFFTHPQWARRGLGRTLLGHCESEAQRAGFRQMELVATLAGQQLYENCGYRAVAPVAHTLPDGTLIPFVLMKKALKPG